MPRKPKTIDPRDWIMFALYDAIDRMNRGTLRIKGDMLSPTVGEAEEFDEDDGDRKPDVGWHHPSGMVGKCMRRKQGALIGLKRTNPVPPEVSIMGFIGTAIHRVAGRLMADHPRVIAIEQHVMDQSVPVRGRYDMSVNDHDDVPSIVDWKGCYSLPDKPKDEHIEQALWYAYMNGSQRVIIQYVARASGLGQRHDMEWAQGESIWEQSLASAVEVSRLTSVGTVAPRTPVNKQECNGCVFLNACEATEAGSPAWQQQVVASMPMLGSL